ISASISTTTLSFVITFCRGNTYTVSRRSILSVRKCRANESPAGVTITWCQSIARGRSMMGMIRLTPEESVRWYLPSRSMIIVWACCTIRMPRATIEIANSTIAAGTISAPMLSMPPAPSALLVHVQRRPLYPHHHHPRPRLERGVHQRRGAPVLALDHHAPLARARVDALRHDADSAREDERDHPRRDRAHRYREQPEPGRDHLGHEEQQGGDEPHLPFVHGEKLAHLERARRGAVP